MWAIKFWDNFSTSSVKRSPSEFPSIWDMELLAKFNLRRLVMLTKSLASIVWMWFSDKSLESGRSIGQEVEDDNNNSTHSNVISPAISCKPNCLIVVIRF